ncbi:MAG: hypothetical protein ABIG92_02210 [Candidatus Omnitrophota bacterium]
MKGLLEYWDKRTIQKGLKENTREHVDLASDIVKQRFYHGYACYDIKDNYIAFLAGRLIWNDFLGIVIPDDILKHDSALCSQQAIIFMELLKNKDYKVRKVALKGHFCAEIFYDNSWHFYDPDKEPDFSWTMPKPSIEELMNNKDLLYDAYKDKLTKSVIDKVFSKYEVSKINPRLAREMTFFHKVTKFLSNWVWVIFLYFTWYYRNLWKKYAI